MAKLQNPGNRIDAIRQDYRDKHNLPNSSVLIGRKFERQVENKNGEKVFDKNGKIVTCKGWYEAKSLTIDEEMYVRSSLIFSESYKNDCYCTLNGFPKEYDPVLENKNGKNKKSYRAVEKLAYLTGFYLDFDHRVIHSMAKTQQASSDLVEEAKNYEETIIKTLEDYLASDYGMPVVSFTGGGYGFYIKIKPLKATKENMQLYIAVWEKLYQRFNVLFKDLLDVFENDHSVLDYVRVIRITGTYNSKTGTYSNYVGRYGNAGTNEIYEYSIEDLVSLYHLDKIEENLSENQKKVTDSPLQKREEKKEGEEISISFKAAIQSSILINSEGISDYLQKENIFYVKKWYQKYINEKQIGRYLELSIESLKYLDDKNSAHRNRSLFLIACFKTELEYDKYGCFIFDEVDNKAKEDVIDYVIELNNNLSVPLDYEELICLIYSALQNVYHFRKLDTIQMYLNLTDAEFDTIGWLDKQKKERQKKERNDAETELDKEVIRLYLSGLSDQKVANELNISKRTVIRIRERLNVTNRNIKFEEVDFEGNKRHCRNKSNSLIAKENRHSEEAEFNHTEDLEPISEDSCTTLNEGQKRAYEDALEGYNVVVSSNGGGTGKSFLIERTRAGLKAQGKVVAVCAPTAVAANNVGGVTVHSAFVMSTKENEITNRMLYSVKNYDTVIIDEAGMLGATDFKFVCKLIEEVKQQFDKMIQVVLVCDVLQLPPVEDAYFFQTDYYRSYGFRIHYLTENIRQQGDKLYLNLLNQVRIGADKIGTAKELNRILQHNEDIHSIYLVAYRDDAARINWQCLKRVPGEVINLGNVKVKIGAKVICTKNNSRAGYFNGMRGVVESVGKNCVMVRTDKGTLVTVRKQTIVTDKSSCQGYPLALGYAVTIHKAQGMTLDSANIDPRAFADGQLYVALSRVKTALGVHLLCDIEPDFIMVNEDALVFDEELRLQCGIETVVEEVEYENERE